MIEEDVVSLLRGRGWKLATAESCTGGLIGHRITNVPGSSAVLLGGVVAYDNEVKERILGVPGETLVRHGAVSEEVARAMAIGARDLLGADIAVAVTGIAGPTGGTPEKPVGTTCIAVVYRDGSMEARTFHWQGDREDNKRRSADAALEMVRAYLSSPHGKDR